MNQNEIVALAAEKYRIDADLITAIIAVESSGVSWRTRFEPHTDKYLYFHREHASKLGITADTEQLAQMHSYGLMQIMGFCARELSFEGYLPELCLPENGIEYGCKKLRQLFDRYADETKVIAAYNAGSPRMTQGGFYENQPYVNKVHAELVQLRKLK